MAAYRTHGAHSSANENNYTSGVSTLIEIANTPKVLILIKTLENDANLHLVGGTVREACFKQSSSTDLDLATCLTPDEVQRRLIKAGIHTIMTGARHGTVTAVVEETNCEITTFRKSRNQAGYSKDILEDLAARDFTINAIAFCLNEKKLIDPHSGLADLNNNILKCVGDSEHRFHEDALRLLRMIRFGPAQGRKIEPTTQQAAKKLASTLSTISIERIQSELSKILLSENPAAALRMMEQLGFLQYTLPELLPAVGFEQNEFHRFDVFEHTLAVIENSPKTLIQRWTALFHDIGKPGTFSQDQDGRRHFYKHEHLSTTICQDVMKRLKFSNELTDSVSSLVRYHMRPFECGAPGVRRLIRDLGPLFDEWLIFKKADAMGAKFEEADLQKRIDAFLELVEIERSRKVGSVYSNLAIDGNDLIDLGVKPGPFLGQILKTLADLVIEEPELNTKECLSEKAKELLKQTT